LYEIQRQKLRVSAIIEVRNLTKTYDNEFKALNNVSLDIAGGEIIALLGPNGAGKTTLISTICGLVAPTSGTVTVGGFDIIRDYRQARRMIGLVPQEITIEPFEKVIATTRLTRGLFGMPADDAHIEKTLRALSLWDKKDARTMELSGGMKRRVLIAKALSHEPKILFLDEPTAGVDVELRKDMWALVNELRAQGTTIILTTHYIEEAEEIADRVGIIANGEILLVEEKSALMQKLGKKELVIELSAPIDALPATIASDDVTLSDSGTNITYSYDSRAERTGIRKLLNDLNDAGLVPSDISTRQSSLEDIFVGLVSREAS
jgi:ABC-2 type transport system ATP-binding protein